MNKLRNLYLSLFSKLLKFVFSNKVIFFGGKFLKLKKCNILNNGNFTQIGRVYENGDLSVTVYN